MSRKSEQDLGINSWLEEELYQQYLHDRTAVDESWKTIFESNGDKPSKSAAPAPPSQAASQAPSCGTPTSVERTGSSAPGRRKFRCYTGS